MNEITANMLKYGGKILVEWMFLIYDQAWRQREIPNEWIKAGAGNLFRARAR